MAKPLKVLIVEDSESDTILLLSLLRQGGYEPEFQRVDSAASLTSALQQQPWDIVLADHLMPGFDSIAALEIVRAASPDLPFLIVSGAICDELAVSAMKAGAQDYLMKWNLSRLVVAVDRELQDAEDRRGRRAAERALLVHDEELRIAREVQQRLFPAAAPVLPGFDIAGASLSAAATGGDYYDFIVDPHGGLFIVVGDVTGHGLGPALLMADVRAYLRALVLSERSLVEILSQTRHLLRADLGSDRFITLFFARLDPRKRSLDFINAGHPAAHVLAAGGQIKAELGSSTPALGIDWAEEQLVPGCLALDPGDLVLFLTDGVSEARSPAQEEFGEARVLEIVRRERTCAATEIVQVLLDEVRSFSEPGSLQDDMTAVVVKVG